MSGQSVHLIDYSFLMHTGDQSCNYWKDGTLELSQVISTDVICLACGRLASRGRQRPALNTILASAIDLPAVLLMTTRSRRSLFISTWGN